MLKKAISIMLVGLLSLIGGAPIATLQAQQIPTFGNPSPISRPGGIFYAAAYNTYVGRIISGNTSTGSGTSIIVAIPNALADGTVIAAQNLWPNTSPSASLTPIAVNDANAETVTPTSTSFAPCPAGNLGVGGSSTCVTITGTFNNTHGQSAAVQSGTFGLQEAINQASLSGGGDVVVDGAWAQLGGTSTMLNAAIVQPLVSILDTRTGIPRYWNATPTGTTLATPTTLTSQAACDTSHQFCSDANVAGSASWGSTVYGCVTYVDIMGNEGPCSATASFTSVASKAIDVAAPAASAGAVGYVVYLSLSGGTYALAYQVPSTSLNCTLTTLETVTPACAVANATYGQAASTFGTTALFTKGGSQITTYPVNTAQSYPILATTAETLLAQHPLTNSAVSYAYAPSSRVGACNVSSFNNVFAATAGAISAGSATTVPNPLFSFTVPSGCINYIGAEFRVSGLLTYTDAGSGTSTILTISWDANGTNTTSVPLKLCQMNDTFTSVSGADNVMFSCTAKVLTTGATGTILAWGNSVGAIAAGATTLMRTSLSAAVAASGSVALNTNARISGMFEAVGQTTTTGAQTIDATLEFLN